MLLLGYIASVLIHEMGHILIAKSIGYNLGNINLMPYGGRVAGFRYNKTIDGIIISIAGPIANIIFSMLIMAFWWIDPVVRTTTFDIFLSSLFLGFINLIPIYPLDGSQFIFLLSKNKIQVSKIVKTGSIIFGTLFIALSIISIVYSFNITIGVFGIFVILSTFFDKDKMLYDYIYINSLKTKNLDGAIKYVSYAIYEDLPLYKMLSKINVNEICEFIVYSKDGTLIGKIKEKDIENIIENKPLDSIAKTLIK